MGVEVVNCLNLDLCYDDVPFPAHLFCLMYSCLFFLSYFLQAFDWWVFHNSFQSVAAKCFIYRIFFFTVLTNMYYCAAAITDYLSVLKQHAWCFIVTKYSYYLCSADVESGACKTLFLIYFTALYKLKSFILYCSF